MELVELILRWEMIVGAAILGAIISMFGSTMMSREKESGGSGRSVLRAGYGITLISIALFIAAGFMSAR